MTDLTPYVDLWWSSVDDFTLLLEDLSPEEWAAPTDLPGWDVRDVAAHTAHLEHVLSGGRHEGVELGEVPHVRNPMGQFTEQGILARRDRSTDDLVNEIRSSATATHTAILADAVPVADAPALGPFGAIGWTNRTLWTNRPIDLWMHEQDIRRATGRPGTFDSSGARHTVEHLSGTLGLVLAKRAQAPAGTTLRLEVAGHAPRAWQVDDEGRGHELAEVPGSADVVLRLDVEGFALLAGGRRSPAEVKHEVDGDAELGRRVVDAMAVTP